MDADNVPDEVAGEDHGEGVAQRLHQLQDNQEPAAAAALATCVSQCSHISFSKKNQPNS